MSVCKVYSIHTHNGVCIVYTHKTMHKEQKTSVDAVLFLILKENHDIMTSKLNNWMHAVCLKGGWSDLSWRGLISHR